MIPRDADCGNGLNIDILNYMKSIYFEQGKIAYWNGEYVPLSEVRISPYDIGFLRGYGIFDVLPVVHGKPFLWERHFERLFNSAEMLHLNLPVKSDGWKEILDHVIKKNTACESIRTVVSGGPSADSYTPEGTETFLVLPETKTIYPESIYTEGVKVMTLDFARQLSSAKIANHVSAIRNLPEKKKAGAFEILYVSGGEVFEAATSNIAMVSHGVIVTPMEGILPGVTMNHTLLLAEKSGLKTERRMISFEEFLLADEVFLTASSKEIVPVVRVDAHVIGTGVPGKVTKKLMEIFANFVKEY